MTRHIVLSVNDNEDYLYHVPLAVSTWSKLGWWPTIFYHGSDTELSRFVFNEIEGLIYELTSIEGYRSDTITQVSRLYAACVLHDDDMIMTGDIDMIPLSDYWQPNRHKITVYGHDLTGYTHFPICYIAMPGSKWKEVMNIENNNYDFHIRRDLDAYPNAKNKDFYKYWFTDQEIITDRLKNYDKTVINRGQYANGFARGRVDRGAWSLDHKEFIDAHLHHQIHHNGGEVKFEQTCELLETIWPNEDFKWFHDYHHKFRQLTGKE